MRWSVRHLCNSFVRCTRSALSSRTVADAMVFAVLLSAIVAAVGPTFFVQSPQNLTYPYPEIALNYTSDTAVDCKYELTNSSGPSNTSLENCANTTLSGVTEGQNSVRVWGNDSANNWNVSDIVYFSVDTVKPVVEFGGATDTSNYYSRNWSYINITVTDASATAAFIDWNNSLAGWWRFNKESGETGTFFRDWSGFGNNGTCSNCPTSTPGKFGSALQFDGINNHLSIPDSDSLDLGGSFTIEGWFKPSRTFDGSADYYQGILDKGAYQLFLDKSDGKLKFFMDSDAPKNWSALGSGLDNNVYALVVWNGSLYAGGYFTSAGGVSANRIARWNGSEWNALGSGMNASVNSLTIWNNSLYAGGYFTSAGGVSANRTARWNGTDWSALGSGMTAEVKSLAVWDGSLYSVGRFTIAGATNVNYTAKWNTSAWIPLGSGTNSDTFSLGVWDGNLYVGGSFGRAGSVNEINSNARWNGTEWSAVGSGTDGFVYSFAVWNNSIYAGGPFTSAGGVSANSTARWNGTDWSALGFGLDNLVDALGVYGGDLYASGWFTSAGGVSANRIARWNGSEWSALGSGLGWIVYSLAVWNGDLYAGGSFTSAGGTSTNYIAKWSSGEERVVESSINSWPADWQHFAVTYDNSSLKLYRNGILEGSVSANISVAANSLPLLLGTTYGSRQGGSSSSGPEQFDGAIDEVRIHRRALGAEEINASFNSGAHRLYHNFTNQRDGVYAFSAYAQDSAGNVNQTETRVLTLDTNPPAWVQAPANQTIGYNTSFSYGLTATDLTGVDRYWLNDNANFTINSSTGLITNNTLLVLGSYLLNISVNDTLGKTNSARFTVNVLFDVTPPAIVLMSPQFANYTTATPNLSLITSENSTIIYDWDGTGNISGCLNCTSYNATYGELVSDSDTLLLLHFNENYKNVSYDQSGKYNATIFGANWTSGLFGYGLLFDGVTAQLNLSNATNSAGAFTISAWVNATGASSSMAVVDKYENVGGGAGYSLFLSNGKPSFGVYRDGSWNAEIEAASDIRNTGWHYLAGIYNGSALKIVLDNASAVTSPGFNYAGGAAPSSTNLTIGNRPGQSWYFNGTIDEVQITNRALNDTELATGRNRRLVEGAHNLTVYARDNYGNWNTSVVSFNTDTTLPFCTFLSANRTYFTNGTPLNFTAFCNDTFSGVAVVYLNASALGGGIVQMSPSGGGNYTYSLVVDNNRSESVNVSIYNVTDAYGNANFSNTRLTLTIDNTNPFVSFNLPLNQSWQKGAITVNYNATDTQTIGACRWRWQNSTAVWSNYSAVACGSAVTFQFNTTNCSDNSSAVCSVGLFANDSASNYNSSELYFRVDNSAPNISSLLPINGSIVYSNTTQISFNVTDVNSGVNLSRLTLNDTQTLYNTTNISCTPISNGYNCSLSLVQADGPKQITIVAYDNLSNIARSTAYYTVGTCFYPINGDWVLNYTQSCANRTIILNGNLTIQSNGNLTFRNVTFLLNGTSDGSRKIDVQGGTFYILDNDGIQSTNDGSNITALNTSNRFLFTVGANSTFEMRNSKLSYAGYAGGGIMGVYYGASENFYLGEGALFYDAKVILTGNLLSNNFNGVVGQVENATIENNTIASNSGSGIQLLSVNSAIIRNKIFSNSQNGLLLFGSGDNRISDNNISANGRGLRLYRASNNLILNNTISSNGGYGITLEVSSENNTVQSNNISYNTNSGGFILLSNYNNLSNNSISSNTDGLFISNSSGINVFQNSFIGNTLHGIELQYSTSTTVSNNSLLATNWDGLHLQSSTSNNFSGNTISGSVRYALYAVDSHNNSFSQDTFGSYTGLYLSGSHNNTFTQATVSSTTNGLYLSASSNNTLLNMMISSGASYTDVRSDSNSTNTLLNSTYSSAKTYFENANSKIFRQWYLTVTTVNTTGSPVNNTNLTIVDNLSTTVFAGQTGADGSVLIPLTASIMSNTTTNYTPHGVVVNINGYFGNASANMNQSRAVTIELKDITPPQLLAQFFEPQYIYPNATAKFYAHIWENVGISQAWIRVATPNGTYNYTLAYESQNSTGQNWVTQITNTSRLGQYNVSYIFLNDTNGNNNSPVVSAYFRVQADLPPNISFVETNAPNIEVNAPVTIRANITDDHNTTSAYISVFQPVNATVSMTRISGNRTVGFWQANYTPALISTYHYQILANDNSSNTAYSRQYSFNSTTYNCTSASRVSDYTNCMSAGCLWTVGAFGVCSFYTSTTDKNTFALTLNSDSTQIVLTNNNALGQISSTTNRNASLNITINSLSLAVPMALNANIPREFAVMTNGLLISPENSTLLSTTYSNYKLSSVINGSGNRSAFAYTSTFGQPSAITLDNLSVPFTYNASTKLANFTVNLGSPHTLDIQFTQPCAPAGGSCGTCCSGLSCCSGLCAANCSAITTQSSPSSSGSVLGLPVTRVSISASATRLDTKVGVPTSFTVTVKNTGTENLTAVTLDVANLTRGWFSIVPSTQNFPVGHEATYRVTVNPSLDGAYNFSIYVPTPRSDYLPLLLLVTSEVVPQSNQIGSTNGVAAPTELQNELQALEQLANQLAENITNAKQQGMDTSSLEKMLEEARLALSDGKPDKAKLLLDYLQNELPKLKTNQAAAAGVGAPTFFILLIVLSVIGVVVAKYKDQLFPKKAESFGETLTFSRETESAPQDTLTQLSKLRSKIIEVDQAIESGNIQKADELYSAIQKEYDSLVINSVSADAQTISALNEAHASIERIYEQLTKKG